MKYKFVCLLTTVFLVTAAATVWSASPQDIKAKMIKRLPTIKALKAKGIIGESNRGYLQFLGANKAQEDEVNAENQDRRAVYTAIAKQQGATVEVVGKQRAIQIAKKAASGQWLQDAKGKWYRKK